MEYEEDRLSSLPHHLLDKILVCLPLDDAINTSLLSKYWRYRWRNIPDLSLDFETFGISSCDKEIVTKVMLSKINWVVSNHTGKIKKFELCIGDHIENKLRISPELNAWLGRLVYSNIEKLAIQCFPSKNHFVPSSIFDLDYLNSLNLCKCTFKRPHFFKDFKNLKTLHLDDVTFAHESSIATFLQFCPNLEQLTIKCYKYSPVLIDFSAPNLQCLCVFGCSLNLNIGKFHKLTVLTLMNCEFSIV